MDATANPSKRPLLRGVLLELSPSPDAVTWCGCCGQSFGRGRQRYTIAAWIPFGSVRDQRDLVCLRCRWRRRPYTVEELRRREIARARRAKG